MIIYKFRIWIGIWLSIMTVLLGGCRDVEPIPDTNIVFQTIHRDTGLYQKLGFINADGTNLEYLKLPDSGPGPPVAPVQTSDAEFLIFHSPPEADSAYVLGYMSSITKNGQIKTYDMAGRATPVLETHQVLVEEIIGSGRSEDMQSSLYLFDLDKNSVVETYYTTGKGMSIGLGTNAIHGSKLLFARYSEQAYPEIILLDIETGEERVIFVEDSTEDNRGPFYPAISPDGQWVAYTTDGGIYIMDIEGNHQKRIVEVKTIYEYSLGVMELAPWPPAPSWSPDSQWIIYHRCTLPLSEVCKDIDDYAIFKANIQTGEEIKLLDGGLNPYWRLTPRQ